MAKGGTHTPHGRRLGRWDWIVRIVSTEYLLDRPHAVNGGAMIVRRAVLSSTILTACALLATWCLAPMKGAAPGAANNPVLWFGAIFAAVYSALYARFAAQWSYLASVYNDIKRAEVGLRGDLRSQEYERGREHIINWKAGFIEDASDLHLASKPLFASVILAWGESRQVKSAFETWAPGGGRRFETIMEQARVACDAHRAHWRDQPQPYVRCRLGTCNGEHWHPAGPNDRDY